MSWGIKLMHVPGNAFVGDFVVAAQIFERVGARGGVVLLVGEGSGFDGRLILHPGAPIEDGEIVVGGEIVGVDALDVLVLDAGKRIFMLLIVGKA